MNEKLDPRRDNNLNQRKAHYKKVPSRTDIFCQLGITKDEDFNALLI